MHGGALQPGDASGVCCAEEVEQLRSFPTFRSACDKFHHQVLLTLASSIESRACPPILPPRSPFTPGQLPRPMPARPCRHTPHPTLQGGYPPSLLILQGMALLPFQYDKGSHYKGSPQLRVMFNVASHKGAEYSLVFLQGKPRAFH